MKLHSLLANDEILYLSHHCHQVCGRRQKSTLQLSAYSSPCKSRARELSSTAEGCVLGCVEAVLGRQCSAGGALAVLGLCYGSACSNSIHYTDGLAYLSSTAATNNFTD